MSNKKCWDIIDKARIRTIEWANEEGNPIFRIEYVATFESWDNGIEVYVFYRNEEHREKLENGGFNNKIKEHYLLLLEEYKYPFDKFSNVKFFFDSDENIKKNYEGSYFFRLR